MKTQWSFIISKAPNTLPAITQNTQAAEWSSPVFSPGSGAVCLFCHVLLLLWLRMDLNDLAFLVLGIKHQWVGTYICGDMLLISCDCLFYFILSIFKSTLKRCLSNIFPPGTKKEIQEQNFYIVCCIKTYSKIFADLLTFLFPKHLM